MKTTLTLAALSLALTIWLIAVDTASASPIV
jgi:hypothetical protein